MKLNAICMVKNEHDIVLETLDHALQFCDNIFVFDNGSTDGTYELLKAAASHDSRIVIAAHSDEVFKNQLRNRVYNMYHEQFSEDDWWYILDADEMLAQDPRPMLEKARAQNKNCMRSWFAQFYFTDKDMASYPYEDHSAPVAQRRHFYRINWREVRFFINRPDEKWDEHRTGRIPPWCQKMFRASPICCHYPERTPEQIKKRNAIRINNPFSFFHLKSGRAENWLRKASDMFFYSPGDRFDFPLTDRLDYYRRECLFWCKWRTKNVGQVLSWMQRRMQRLIPQRSH